MDLVCPEDEALLVLHQRGGGWRRWLLVYGLRLVVIGALVTAARWRSPFPVYAMIILLLAFVLGLRLRAQGTGRTVVLAVFVVSAACAPLAGLHLSVTARQWTVALLLVALAAAWIHLCVRGAPYALEEGLVPEEVAGLAAQVIVGSVAVALAAVAILALLASPAGSGLAIAERVRPWLVLLAASAVPSALVVALLASVIRTYGRIDRSVGRRFVCAPFSEPFQWGGQARALVQALQHHRRDHGGAIMAMHVFALRVKLSLIETLNATCNLLARAGHLLRSAVIGSIESLRVLRILTLRRLRATAAFAALCIRISLGALGVLLRRYARALLVPLASLLVLLGTAWSASQRWVAYLDDATLDSAVATVGFCGAAYIATVVAWGSWSGLPWSTVWRSERCAIGTLGPRAFVLFVTFAWLLGLAGIVGVADVRPGPITLGSTGVLLAMSIGWQHRADPAQVGSSHELR